MDEHEKLLDLNNYKILIQLKKNRIKKLKTRYLTPEFEYSENINDALVFDSFQDAEHVLATLNLNDTNPRIFIKYDDPDEIYETELVE